jgi:replicative DNA helicase
MAIKDDIENLEDVITSVLLNHPDLVLTEPLDLSLFDRRKAVIHAIVKLSGRGIVPDIFTVSDELNDQSMIAVLGYLQKDVFGSPKNYAHYLKSLRDKVIDVRMYQRLREGMKAIADGTPAANVLGEIVTESMRLFTSADKRQYAFTAKEMMSIMVDKLEGILDKGDEPEGILTGIPKVDSILGSLHPSDMCVVGARPGVGKTALGVTVMLNAAFSGKRVGFISTEMSVDQIAFRVSAQVAKIDAKKYRTAGFDDQEWTRVSASTARLAQLNIRVCDKPVMKVSDVMLQCRAWEMDGGLDLVVVDYLTRLKPDSPTGSQNVDVGEIATQMKNLARDLKIPVIVLAQLNRGSTNRGDQTPRMSDLRDSGIIEQEADSILILHREENVVETRKNNKGFDEPIIEKSNFIIVEKNRHGECMRAAVEFDEPTMRWWSDEPMEMQA